MKIFIIIILSIAIFFSCNNNSTQKKAVKAESTEFKISNNPLNDSIQNISNEIKLKPAEHIVRSSQLPNNNHPILKYEDVKNGDTIFFTEEKDYNKYYNFYSDDFYFERRYGINQQLPYGPEELVNNVFPSDYFLHTKKDFYDTTGLINDLYKICKYYLSSIDDTLSAYWGGDSGGEGSIGLPKINSAQFHALGSSDNLYNIFSVRKSLDVYIEIMDMNVIYRFPDVNSNRVYLSSNGINYGGYNCFPFYANEGYIFEVKDWTAYLIIVNKRSNHAHIIPIISFKGCKNVIFQFFYITMDEKILVYEMESQRLEDGDIRNYDEYKVRVRKTDIITINSNNEIVIKNLNNSY